MLAKRVDSSKKTALLVKMTKINVLQCSVCIYLMFLLPLGNGGSMAWAPSSPTQPQKNHRCSGDGAIFSY